MWYHSIYVTFKWAGAGKLAPGGVVTGEGEEGGPWILAMPHFSTGWGLRGCVHLGKLHLAVQFVWFVR